MKSFLLSFYTEWMRFSTFQRMRMLISAWILLSVAVILLGPIRYSPRVEVEAVQRLPMDLVVRAAGTLEAKASLTAKAQFDGPVVYKNFREGTTVKKGSLLLIVGRDRIRLDYQTKSDALANARADAMRARREVRLQQVLYQKQAVALSAVEDARRAQVRAEQALKAAEESFRLENDRWNAAKVFAPQDGTVVKDGVGDDKFVQTGRELMTVADVSEYTPKVRVDELDIKSIREGQLAEIKIPLFPDVAFPAQVSQIGSTIDGGGLSEIGVTLKLLSTQSQMLRPKLTVEARIATGKTEPTLSVPKSAIANTDGDSKVWVMDTVGRLRLRPVELGVNSADRVQVKSGLKEGDRVCVEAEPDWVEGMKAIAGKPTTAEKGRSKTQALLAKEKKDAGNSSAQSGFKMGGGKRN